MLSLKYLICELTVYLLCAVDVRVYFSFIRSAVLMSELLYYLMMWDCRTKSGRRHQRVVPLIFAIRQWASCKKVTRTNPGPYISNFMLTMLIIHFLQTRHQPVLPSLKALKLASSGNMISQVVTLFIFLFIECNILQI
jgi:TUTase nucleotidyltransferase domain